MAVVSSKRQQMVMVWYGVVRGKRVEGSGREKEIGKGGKLK